MTNAFGQSATEEAAELAAQWVSRGVKTVVICDTDGCLTDNTVRVDTNGLESLTFTKRDFWLIPDARKAGIEVVIHTSDKSVSIPAARAAKVSVPFIGVDGGKGKAPLVRAFKAAGARVIYIGDAPADVEAMKEADEAWCPSDADLGPGAVFESGTRDGYKIGETLVRVTYVKGGHGVLHEVLGYLLAEVRK